MADVHLSVSELTRWRDRGEGDRDRIIAHLAVCGACRHTAAELERDRPLDGEASQFRPQDFVARGYGAGSRSGLSRATSRYLYVAAAAVLVVAAAVAPSWWRGRSDSAFRGDANAVTLVRPIDATVSATDLAFEWTTGSGVDRLRLHVVAIDDPSKPLIDRDVTGTRYEPTADERSRLQSGRELHWFIEYRDSATATGTSPAAGFRVR
jgi:hypothetical protein